VQIGVFAPRVREHGGHVVHFAHAALVCAFRVAHAAQIGAISHITEPGQRFGHRVHDFVGECAAFGGVGVGYEDDAARFDERRIQAQTFEFAHGAGDLDQFKGGGFADGVHLSFSLSTTRPWVRCSLMISSMSSRL